MENGTKEMQLQAVILMAKVHMKMGAIKLESAPSPDDEQEESKIADEDNSVLQDQEMPECN